jgi:CubicO group peptidase (beta-lactamase class C family)
MKTTPLVLPSLLLAIACGSLRAESPATEPGSDPIAARVDALFAEWSKPDSPGCAVGVVRAGKTLVARGYGMADLEHDIPITPRTVFYIGSVGKQFTAYAVVRLAQQGKISLDDEVRKYVPELHDFGPRVTIRQLFHHTSGLRDFFELLSLSGMREGDLVTQKDLLGMIFKQRELNFHPGERFLYSNSNYALLATIVERVTGESFRDWMAQNVFAPLGMNQTQVCDDHQRIIKNRAWSYRSDPGKRGAFKTVVFPYSGYGAGGIYSTAEDLARWVSNCAKPRPGDERTISQMVEPGRLNNGQAITYAFALMVDEYRGRKRVGHTGSLAGYRAYLGFFPDEDLGMIVLCNLASFPPGKAMELADLFLAEKVGPRQDAKPSSATDPVPVAARPPAARAAVQSGTSADNSPALTADELRGYTGSYSSPELGAICKIDVDQDHLIVKHARNEDVRLAALGKDQFTGAGSFQQVHFERDAQGRINGLRVSNGRALGVLFQRQP